ncbi:MAG: HAMP domain-containing histidine kinase [Cyanobacteria bacterium SID2]|nr:HAMP domain-containing histidine kinase [Cyanobacteria bacterium SID2]MBP0004012.1 HAMP domain-containing histidine kinase [Cyanobacteria bacterium SBC]
MFQRTRLHLLLSYVGVLSLVLTTFAISVRTIFARNLERQLLDRLETLGRAAVLELEIDEGNLEVDNEDLVGANQGIQWFDVAGNVLAEQGNFLLKLPFDPDESLQIQTKPYPARGFTIPIYDEETNVAIGYTRVSESTEEFAEILQNLDWGLGTGVLLALGLSGLGGLWLTRQAMRPIERSFRKLQQFTSDASHELRSPLMAIQTNAAVALKYSENIRESDAEKFRAIKSASKQLTKLTENLLLLARSDRNVIQTRAQVDLKRILEQLLKLYQDRATTRGLQFKSRFTSPLRVLGDEVELTRLFTNLIDNALRYTPKGGKVELYARRKSNAIEISVRDTGIGIASENIDRIFDRFWRADRARSYKTGGFGLGLAISRSIARNHGGSIAVTSKLGKGSCFTVSLPSIASPLSKIQKANVQKGKVRKAKF